MSATRLTERFAKDIKGVLHCFDRVARFGTYKAIGWPGAMGRHWHERGVRLLDYPKAYANALRLELAQRVKAVAAEEGLAVLQVNAGQRKEALVEQVLARPGRRAGLVCILGAMERCRCYKVGKDQVRGFLQLQWSPGKCQHYYLLPRCGVWPGLPAHPHLGAVPAAGLLQRPRLARAPAEDRRPPFHQSRQLLHAPQ